MIATSCYQLIVEALDIGHFGVFGNLQFGKVADHPCRQAIFQVDTVHITLLQCRKEQYWSVLAHSHAGDVIWVLAMCLADEHETVLQ